MSLLPIIVIVVVVLLVIGLLAWAVTRKRRQQARIRADELRSEAANRTSDVHLQEAKAREAEAEAQRARAQADRLEAQAHEERLAHDHVRAQQEDHLREADRLDPDVDHTATEPATPGHTTPGQTMPGQPGQPGQPGGPATTDETTGRRPV